MNSKKANQTLVVEFIGVTGVGKSTLIAALTQALSAQGVRVGNAEVAILAAHGLALPGYPELRSALTLLLGLPAFGRYFLTREGASLSRMALELIGRGMGSAWIGVHLLRNFMKRIGAHLLLERLRGGLSDYDVVIWDEGAVHAAHNLFVHTATEPRREEIVEFGRIVPKPDVVVWVTAPTAQSRDVVLARGHSRVPATANAAQAFVEHAQTTFRVLCGVPELRQRIYRVDNSALAADRNGAAIRTRARALGDFLLLRLRESQPQLPRPGGSKKRGQAPLPERPEGCFAQRGLFPFF